MIRFLHQEMRINDFLWKSVAFPEEIIYPNISNLLRVLRVLRVLKVFSELTESLAASLAAPGNSGNGRRLKTVVQNIRKRQPVAVFRFRRCLPHFAAFLGRTGLLARARSPKCG